MHGTVTHADTLSAIDLPVAEVPLSNVHRKESKP
jgi:3-dehydroquinate dehydratase